MTNYSKVGNRAGKPAYRTPSSFRYRKYIKTKIAKSKNMAARKKFKELELNKVQSSLGI